MQTLHGRCGRSPRQRPKALGRFDADREAASRRLAPLSRRGPRRHPRGIGVRSPVSRRSGSAAHGGVQAETLLVGTQRLGECGVSRLGALHREHLGACRAWGASAANRPQRSIFHRLFAPWLGYGLQIRQELSSLGPILAFRRPKPDRLPAVRRAEAGAAVAARHGPRAATSLWTILEACSPAARGRSRPTAVFSASAPVRR